MSILRVPRVWLYIGVATFLVAAAFIWLPSVRVVLHSIVNVFATGRTGTKALIFMAYVISVSGILYVRSKKTESTHTLRYWKVFTATSALGAYVLNFFTYLWTMKLWHIPVFTYSLIYNNGSFTSFQFVHNHATKGAIAVLTQLLPEGVFGHLDAGTALLGIIPNALLSLQALLVLGCIIGIYGIWHAVLPRITALSSRRAVVYVAMLILSSFMVLKSLLDGGIFSFEAVVGLSFFFFLISKGSTRARNTLLVVNGAYFILLGLLYWVGYFATDSNYGYHNFSFVTILLVMTALYGIYEFGKTRLTMLVLMMAVIPLCVQVYNGLTVFEYRNISVEKDDIAYIFSYENLDIPGYTLRHSIGKINLYTFSPREPMAIADIIPHTGFADNMTPVSVAWKTCVPPAPRTSYTLNVVSPNAIDMDNEVTQLYRMDAVPLGTYDDGFHRYSVTISAHPCSVPQLIVFVQEILAKHFGGFAIYDIQQFENGE
ncbi:MAG: hypothetical protein AAB365_02640 [Patescibacteria group bacterium]